MPNRTGFATARLVAEPAAPHHAAAMARALADPQVHLWTSDRVPDAEHFARQFAFVSALPCGRSPDGCEIWLTWALMLVREPDVAIGYVQSSIREPDRVLIAYMIGRDHWRRGYASEAVAAMLDWVLARYDVACAVAEIDTRNAASRGLAEALGFRKMGLLKETGTLRGAPCDDDVYGIDRADWIARRFAVLRPPAGAGTETEADR